MILKGILLRNIHSLGLNLLNPLLLCLKRHSRKLRWRCPTTLRLNITKKTSTLLRRDLNPDLRVPSVILRPRKSSLRLMRSSLMRLILEARCNSHQGRSSLLWYLKSS